MNASKKTLFKNKKKLLLKARNFTRHTGKAALTILKTFLTPFVPFVIFILKILDIIGRLFIFYLKKVKATILRLALLIQFIGEATLLFGFVIVVVVKALLLKTGIIKKQAGENAFAKTIKLLKQTLSSFNLLAFCKKVTYYRPPRYAVVAGVITLLLWSTYYSYFLKNLPSPYDLEKKPLPASSQVLDRQGNLLFLAYNGKINRVPILLAKIPKHVREATIAVEDQDFYYHRGISVRGVVRAFVNNLRNKPTQGGSTITQQLVKIALLKDNRRIVSRKIKEAYLSLLIERVYSKEKILEMYLNNAPYGGTAYGIEAAARKYFGKDASQLTLAEAALLATLPTAPTLYSPYETQAAVYKRNQKRALEQMIQKGFITLPEGEETYRQHLSFYSIDNQIYAPHFVFWLLGELENTFGKQLVQEGGLIITTTLDLPSQLLAERIVKENIEKLEGAYWISNGAALVTHPQTGEILAMVGSRDYFDDEHDGKFNVTVSRRQPGSAIKVVNYAYALSKGGFTPSSTVDDSPVTYSNAWETYSPRNYDGKYRGRVTVKQALAMSLNVPAVKVLNTYGPDKMRELGIEMGIESWQDLKNYGLSLTLGAGDVRMTELATVYGTLANLGKRIDLFAVKKITDGNGHLIADSSNNNKKSIFGISQAQAASEENEVIPQYTAYQLTNILSDNAARLPAFGPYAKLEIPGHKVAVKTGTTNDIRDNWTIGYTPDILVTTWVGNNDNKPMNPRLTSGITGAAPIWNEIMTNLISDKPMEQYATPSGMIKIKICAVNGLLTCPRCPKEVEEYFMPGTEPKTKCYFPSAEDCKVKKEQMEKEGKSPDEISKALVNCPTGT